MRFISDALLDKERPIKVVPRLVVVTLIISLISQVSWHAWRPSIEARASELSEPPHEVLLQVLSLGEQTTLSKILMLWLQAFDNQPGISIPFKELDYDRVIAWLELIMKLDNRSHYPLLSASRIYSEVPDNNMKRQMLDFVFTKFIESPNERWLWLAHAVYVAKHRIQDLELAKYYARALRVHATAEHVPDWAKQMELFILEDLDDVEGAKILLGGLLDSGVINDPDELKYFVERLENR